MAGTGSGGDELDDEGVDPPVGEPGWVDLAGTAAGIGVAHEAAWRRQREGAGADLSWRVGAEGEAIMGAVLEEFCAGSRWDRLRRRPARWRLLHDVKLGNARGEVRGDVDHLLIGPPGVVTINTKHHRVGRVVCDGDQLTVNRRRTEYVRKARREADRVRSFLTTALAEVGHAELAGRLVVSPAIAVVAATVQVHRAPAGVLVARSTELTSRLVTMSKRLPPADVEAVYEVARRSTTWVRPADPA